MVTAPLNSLAHPAPLIELFGAVSKFGLVCEIASMLPEVCMYLVRVVEALPFFNLFILLSESRRSKLLTDVFALVQD